ncbi:MAG: hypothetical protein AABX70_00180 [Nanoarchaeota archaeon]
MNLTTIQLRQDTKKKLEQKKLHPRESYDAVIQRALDTDNILSLEEAFRQSDQVKLKRKYSTEEVIALTHAHRKRP